MIGRCLFCLLTLFGTGMLATPGTARAQERVEVYGTASPLGRPAETMVLQSTTDIAVLGPLIQTYVDSRPGVQVRFEQWGSNDLYELGRQSCREGRSDADVLISSAVHQMVQLVNEACAARYASRSTAQLPQALRWRDELWGITREPAVIVYNKALVPPEDVPRSRFDLLDLLRPTQTPYRRKVATYDIERSGLGYLFAFIDAQEATTFGALQESFSRTQAISTCCSLDIIKKVAEGDYLIAYNVLGSYAQDFQRRDDRIGIVVPSDYSLVLSRAFMIPRHAPNFLRAADFLEFMLSPQGRLALQDALLISPILETGDGAEAEPLNASILRPIELSPALLVALDKLTRETFLRRWRDTFAGP